jgi:DNA-binding MarR family transcriptional regulator
MDSLTLQTKQISKLLPEIARNLRIARLIDDVKPGLTTSQLMILLILQDKEDTPLSVGKLAEQLSVSFPSVSGIIDRLYKEKFVERKRSTEDRRLVLVELTSAGKVTVAKLLNAFEKLLFDVLKNMPETERKTIVRAAEKVTEFSTTLSKEA